MSNQEEKTAMLITELHQTISVVGVERTIKTLQVARTKTASLNDEQMQKIIQTVCDKFNITFVDLLNNYNSGWEKKYAMGFICYYAITVFNYKGREMSNIFKKTEGLVSKHLKIIKQLRSNHKSEADMYKLKEYFDKNLKNL